MKRVLTILAMALAAVAFTACGGDEPGGDDNNTGDEPAKTPDLSLYQKINYPVRDLALIYQGARHRIDWTEEDFYSYLTHRFLGAKEEWTFDGFLFIEFTTGLDEDGHHFCANNFQPNARRVEYEWYIERLFEKGKSLDALDKAIDTKKKKIGDPGFKHKIVLTTFVPVIDQTDWGEIDGVKMSFRKDADRLTVIKWFIDTLIERFKAENYENLELFGIYMLTEDDYQISTISSDIKRYIHRKGLDYLWIPYYMAHGVQKWKDYGFDIAYMQPNHFFSPELPDSRLDDALSYCNEANIAVEFECDDRALSQAENSFWGRMKSYIDAFETYGVWYKKPIAYYTGFNALIDFDRNPSPQNTILTERFYRHIVNRRLAAEAAEK